MRGTLRERLQARLIPCTDPACDCRGCLLWTGCLNSRGYGVIGADGKRLLVHRAAWSLDNGPIPSRLTIDHVHNRGCRHKTCALVAHLQPVTIKENTHRSLAQRGYAQYQQRGCCAIPRAPWKRLLPDDLLIDLAEATHKWFLAAYAASLPAEPPGEPT